MDFIDQIKQHAGRVAKMKDNCPTEEATKMSLVIPFFKMLGYDVYNPEEFLPEFIADVGIKKGEKVDYAIVVNGDPTILIECKWSGGPLERHDSQLFRYFGTTTAKFAILTNGLVYKFYTDLDEANKMDLTPFLEIDLLNLKETLVSELKMFHKDSFDPESLATAASELKYSKAIKDYFAKQMDAPSDSFVRYFAGKVYDGMKTQAVMERFTALVKSSLNDFITERMNDKLKTALGQGAPIVVAPQAASDADEAEDDEAENEIITAIEEVEAFYAIKGILLGTLPLERISYKSTQTYCSILVDEMPSRWIARLSFGERKKRVQIPGADKKVQRYSIDFVDDLYGLQEQLIAAANLYV